MIKSLDLELKRLLNTIEYTSISKSNETDNLTLERP